MIPVNKLIDVILDRNVRVERKCSEYGGYVLSVDLRPELEEEYKTCRSAEHNTVSIYAYGTMFSTFAITFDNHTIRGLSHLEKKKIFKAMKSRFDDQEDNIYNSTMSRLRGLL